MFHSLDSPLSVNSSPVAFQDFSRTGYEENTLINDSGNSIIDFDIDFPRFNLYDDDINSILLPPVKEDLENITQTAIPSIPSPSLGMNNFTSMNNANGVAFQSFSPTQQMPSMPSVPSLPSISGSPMSGIQQQQKQKQQQLSSLIVSNNAFWLKSEMKKQLAKLITKTPPKTGDENGQAMLKKKSNKNTPNKDPIVLKPFLSVWTVELCVNQLKEYSIDLSQCESM
ncbi:hypothetical protein TRFO_39700 [Tritrichomonas foetus]|uniref:Uncharacterized protein n=1 Tax=Tritrichomonas foetus TaxID=1144522 RepID=A0A1J4J3V3_9EUKA|nr:hypothetical protein TRFO_39700 [Tritrichomonas foetus]|eukprot:OHS94128.1 hypothetical protein TRFO_39700 [Tritrichomonas foetus]